MTKHNPVNITLKYQCRYDAGRRFLKPKSCEKAPLKNLDGEIIKECRTCPGPLDLNPNKRDEIMATKALCDDAQEALANLAFTHEPPAKVKLDLPKPQMCGCGRDYGEPKANGAKGKCRLCKKEQAARAKRFNLPTPKEAPEPTPEPEPAVKLCKKCGEKLAMIRKDGISLGLCANCKSEAMQNARAIKATAETTPAIVKPAKALPNNQPAPVVAPPAASAMAERDRLLPRLLLSIHEFWAEVKERNTLLAPAVAEILITGDMLYNLNNERQAK